MNVDIQKRTSPKISRTSVFLVILGSVFFGVLLCIYPLEAANGAANGLGCCLNILIPSLFPFMVLSVFVIQSGAANYLDRPLGPFCRLIFRLPGSSAAAIFMSMIGGYPVGARCVSALLDQGEISRQQARRMHCFCINAGPAFVITAVGAGYLHSIQSGVILLISQLAACLLLGLFCRERKKESIQPRSTSRKPVAAPGQALIHSTADAARSMCSMCCFVILFAVLISFLEIFIQNPAISAWAAAFLEVTNGCAKLSQIGIPLWIFAFFIGWGGLCVHFQILSLLRNLLMPLGKFFLFRFLHGVLCAAIAFFLCKIWPVSSETFSNVSTTPMIHVPDSPAAAVCLIVLCIIFLVGYSKHKASLK